MKVSYAWLNTYFKRGTLGFLGGGLPRPHKLAERFNAHAFEVEGIERGVSGDTVLDIKVLPDRAHYALSHRGIAGEAAAIAKKAFKAPKESEVILDDSVSRVVVTVTDSKLCPRYMARSIEGVRVGASPKWLSERLEAIGQRSINNIVDSLNYVMFDVGQPLHAFDADKVEGQITVRAARPGEKITLLDGREVALLENDLLIADDAGPLVIAGVKGGKRAEVTDATKSIIIESANFNSTTVRRTSTRLNLRNDSSKRFENEITPALAAEGMDGVTSLIAKLCPGIRVGKITDLYPTPVKPWTVTVDPQRMNDVTGLDLSAHAMVDILKSLRCAVSLENGKILVTPPLERLDLVIPEDIADELGRMYGYDKLPSKETPNVPAVPVDKVFYWSESIKNALVDLGFSETLLYTLVAKGDFEISYPLASDKSALRQSLAPKVIEALSMNSLNAALLGLDAIKVFEIGKTFAKDGERTSLCIGVSQVKKRKGVTAESILKESLVGLNNACGKKQAIKLDGQIRTGAFGAVVEIDIDAAIVGLESGALSDLSFTTLPPDKRYKPFSQYPYIVRDVALFVPSGTPDAEVSGVIALAASVAASNMLVKGPDLFDRFEKDGRVSYAYRMIFQSSDRTLSDDEVNGWMEKVYTALKSKGWEVR